MANIQPFLTYKDGNLIQLNLTEDYMWCHKKSTKDFEFRKGSFTAILESGWDIWKKWHVSWNVSGGWNLNRRRFGERRAFQTEATVGKKDPMTGG